MAIKITAKNKKLNGTFLGDIEFKNGKATVDGNDKDKQRAIVFAQRSGLDWEDSEENKAGKPTTK